MQMIKKDTITSLELLEQINLFRSKERELSLENKNNRLLSDRTHDNLIKAIRDEFSEEISLGELNESNYSSRGKQFNSFILTLSQGKQMLARESRFVRKAIIKHIEELELTIKLLLENKLDKKQQVEAMKKFGGLLPEIEAQESLPYVKINTCVNKAVSNYFGFPKMIKKDAMTYEMLEKRNEIMQRFLVAYELFRDISKAKEFIYEEFRQVSIECNED